MILREEIDAILSNAVLKEERGVAAYKYKGVVDEIISYCNEYVKPGNVVSSFFKNIFGGNKKYKITVPREITKKIDFIENLDVVITLEEMGSPDVTNSGGGYIQYFKGPDGYFTKDGKICHGKIVVEGYHHNGKILTRTITNTIYHELNHAYDVWNRKKAKLFVDEYSSDVNKGYYVKDNLVFSSNERVNNFFREIFYRLFIPTELNAMVSGVYGDLRGMDSKRGNYRRDIHNTQAGWILDGFAENFDNFMSKTSIEVLMDACKIMHIDGVSMQDPYTFVTTFKQVFEKKMRAAWKGVGRAASRWYDDKEEMENDNNLKTL